MKELKPCPFCGGKAEVERRGNSRVSCIVVCSDCGCRLEINENGAGEHWNNRQNTKDNDLSDFSDEDITMAAEQDPSWVLSFLREKSIFSTRRLKISFDISRVAANQELKNRMGS